VQPVALAANRVNPMAAKVPRYRSAQLCTQRTEWPRWTIDRM
jgi:hypothetical protein